MSDTKLRGKDVIIKMTQEEYETHLEEYDGLCLECGAFKWGDTEPDAENYPCEDCGARKVEGIENAFLAGHIELEEPQS